ncbi:MAG: 50S ribosomal protein L25 [Candidatus Margulisiibacteriota bacterium]
MAKVEVKAKDRIQLGKEAKKVRRTGFIPAIVYGHKFGSSPVAVDMKEYVKKVLRSESGTNLIFDLIVEGSKETKSIPVITYAMQKDTMTDEIIHLDFKHIVMDEKIKAKIPVELIGIPFGVKDEAGVLVHGLREIEIRCFPGDIPDKYNVDVTHLKINESMQVEDLKVSDKIEILSAKNEMIATVTQPTKEEVVTPAAPTAEEAAAATATAAGTEVAAEGVKEKSAPGAAPAKEKAAGAEKK